MLGKTNISIGGGGEASTLRVKNKTGEKIVKGQKLFIKNQCYEQTQNREVNFYYPGYTGQCPIVVLYENGRYFYDGKYVYAIKEDLSYDKVSQNKENHIYNGANGNYLEIHDKYGNIFVEGESYKGYLLKDGISVTEEVSWTPSGTLLTGEYYGGFDSSYVTLRPLIGKLREKGEPFAEFSTGIGGGAVSKEMHIIIIDDYFFARENAFHLNTISKTAEKIETSFNFKGYAPIGATPDNKYALFSLGTDYRLNNYTSNRVYEGGIIFKRHNNGILSDIKPDELKEFKLFNNNLTNVWYDGHNGILSIVKNFNEIHVFKYDQTLEDFKEVPFFIDIGEETFVSAPRISADFSVALIKTKLNSDTGKLFRLTQVDGYAAGLFNNMFTTEGSFVGYATEDCEPEQYVEATILYPNTKTDVTFNVNADATLTVE